MLVDWLTALVTRSSLQKCDFKRILYMTKLQRIFFRISRHYSYFLWFLNVFAIAKYSYLGDFSVPRNKYEVVTAEDSGRIKRDTLADIDYAKLLKDFEDS
ncbi:hypothetical protein AVEN_202478-1, partial [Araneus ventricosus]